MIEKINDNLTKNIDYDLNNSFDLNSKDFSNIESNPNFESLNQKIDEQENNLDKEIENKWKYPMIKKYKQELQWLQQENFKKFLKWKNKEINLYWSNITDIELKDLIKELSNYKDKNLLTNLEELNISSCQNIINLDLEWLDLGNLKSFYFWWQCESINLKSTNLTNLKQLDFKYKNIESIDLQWAKLNTLEDMSLSNSNHIVSVNLNWAQLDNLLVLSFSYCKNLKKLDLQSSKLNKLQDLYINNCYKIESLDLSWLEFNKLFNLNLNDSINLKKINIESTNLDNLKELNLSNCYNLESINFKSANLKSLSYLYMNNCYKIESLDFSWFDLSSLINFEIKNCYNLKELNLESTKLDNLRNFDFTGSTNLKIEIDENILNKTNSYNFPYEFKKHIPENIKFNAFLNYFSNKEIKIWKPNKESDIEQKKVKIDLSFNKNLLFGLLKTMKKQKKEDNQSDEEYFDIIQKIYEQNIVDFIETWKEDLYNIKDLWWWKEELTPKSDNIVFSIFANDDVAMTKENREKSDNHFKSLCKKENFKNYNVNGWTPKLPDDIMADIENTVKNNPNSQIIIKMAGHWDENGILEYNWTIFTKIHFAKLFNLWSNVHINITSCNSWYKDDDTNYDVSWNTFEEQIKSLPNFANNHLWSLILDSSLQISIWWNSEYSSDYDFFQAFEKKDSYWNYEADYDWNWVVTYQEAVLYRDINYNYSLTPTSFDHDNNSNTDMVEIVKNWNNLKNIKNKT